MTYLTFELSRDDLDAIFGQTKRPFPGDRLFKVNDDPLLHLSGQKPHTSCTEDVERRLVMFRDRNVSTGKVQ